MDRTPKISKLPSRRNDFPKGAVIQDVEMRSCTTPSTKMLTDTENDESPIHIASTQEGYDNVDVVWDWNSPQAKQRPKRKQKRLLSQSPRNCIKRHSSNNNIQNFEKLREELQSLREAMAIPDNEESLVLSPLEEAEYKDVNNDQNANDVLPLTQEICLGANDDLFNDSVDEELLLCTQKIEAQLEVLQKNTNSNNLINRTAEHTKTTYINENIKNIENNVINQCQSTTNNSNIGRQMLDSFNVLKKVNGEHLEATNCGRQISYIHGIKQITGFARTKSENECINSRQVGKVEFYRTQSFESTVEYTAEVIPQYKLDEIERKRKEALAKLELKRKQGHSDSPSKCSPEEIEQKRLQALAKLEAKRQQEIIERKRQEALKRLEQSRKKNAKDVKSSLSKRL